MFVGSASQREASAASESTAEASTASNKVRRTSKHGSSTPTPVGEVLRKSRQIAEDDEEDVPEVVASVSKQAIRRRKIAEANTALAGEAEGERGQPKVQIGPVLLLQFLRWKKRK